MAWGRSYGHFPLIFRKTCSKKGFEHNVLKCFGPPEKSKKTLAGFGLLWVPGTVDLGSSKMGATLGFHRELLGRPGGRVIAILHFVSGKRIQKQPLNSMF